MTGNGRLRRSADAGRGVRCPRRATALLVCVFVLAMITAIVVSMFDSQMLEVTAARHTRDYEQALYLAGAGVHDALAQIEALEEPFAPFDVGPVEFPAGSGNVYQADAVEDGGNVVITAAGTSGNITRYLEVTITQVPP